jgi:hypothetical protein
LAAIWGLLPIDWAAPGSLDWQAAETAVGTEIPDDYKRFADAYGPGLVEDHLIICTPGVVTGWTDLLDNNEMAHESCRIWFGGVDVNPFNRAEEAWPLGDSSRWNGDDVPDWFQPGDDLISWGGTGNSDFLFWHIRPCVAAADHPVVLRERGPYFERFEADFAATLTGLLTGAIRSDYLSRWLQGPHSYGLAGRRA